MNTHSRRDQPHQFEGQRLFDGRYLLLGAVGVDDPALGVHEALDCATQRKVIVTVVLHERHLARLRNAVDIAWALQNPHLDSVVQANLSGELLGDGRLVRYVVTRWLNGGSVRALTQDTRERAALPSVRLALAASLVAALAPALDGLHERDIVHAGIQPDKIMLHSESAGDDFQPVLVDFGLVRRGQTAPADAVTRQGNPAYIAPEQWSNALLDGRADQYSLALTLYELISGGVSPFQAARDALLGHERAVDATMISPRAIWRGMHERGQFTPLTSLVPEVSEEVCAVFARALATTPAERFPTLAGFARALADAARTQESFANVLRTWRAAQPAPAAADGTAAGAARALAETPRKPRHPLLRYFSRG